MKITDITQTIEKIVPLKLAQHWDNVGLLIGDARRNVKNILLTIDITPEVLAEAKKLKTEMIISYHPVIWDGLKKITSDDAAGGIVYDLICAGIAVFSIHTALDAAEGGVNDGLAEIVGIADAEPIGDYVENPYGQYYKFVVFVPNDALAAVADAVFAAGAGHIGNYTHCGFYTQGQGSFLPTEGAKPAIGKKGRLEKVAETRFEAIVPAEKLTGCVAAMRKAHPYEMPAFDVIKLYNARNRFGLGRIGTLKQPTPLGVLIERIKKHTGAKAIGIVGQEKKLVKKAAVCAGSCGKIINAVIAQQADLYLTGELKHHHALAARQAGVTCLCLSHTVSERFILKKLANRLQKQMPQLTIRISAKDSDPFRWKNL